MHFSALCKYVVKNCFLCHVMLRYVRRGGRERGVVALYLAKSISLVVFGFFLSMSFFPFLFSLSLFALFSFTNILISFVFLFFIFMYFIVFVFLPLSFSDFLILSLPGATFLSYCPKVSWPYFSFLFKLHFFALTCPCQDLLFPCQDLSRFVL